MELYLIWQWKCRTKYFVDVYEAGLAELLGNSNNGRMPPRVVTRRTTAKWCCTTLLLLRRMCVELSSNFKGYLVIRGGGEEDELQSFCRGKGSFHRAEILAMGSGKFIVWCNPHHFLQVCGRYIWSLFLLHPSIACIRWTQFEDIYGWACPSSYLWDRYAGQPEVAMEHRSCTQICQGLWVFRQYIFKD